MEFLFESFVPVPREAVFAFHADPANLLLLMEGQRAFRLLAHDGSVRPGSTTRVEVRLARLLPFRMAFRHATLDPPRSFSEEQVRGPFRRFRHVHEFEERPGGTLVRDRLVLELPPLLGGAWALRRIVAPMVRGSFAQRHGTLRALAERGSLAAVRG